MHSDLNCFRANVDMKFNSLYEIVSHLSRLIERDNIFSLTIPRSDVLGTTLCGINRKSFTPTKFLEV